MQPEAGEPATAAPQETGAQSTRERDFSLRARRTSRVGIRLPLKLTLTDGSGAESTFNAFTAVVNKHGARLTATQTVRVNELVKLSVLSTKKSAQAKVVWAESKKDANGEYAFAVELLKASNLFDLNFSHEDDDTSEPIDDLSLMKAANILPPGTNESADAQREEASAEAIEDAVPAAHAPRVSEKVEVLVDDDRQASSQGAAATSDADCGAHASASGASQEAAIERNVSADWTTQESPTSARQEVPDGLRQQGYVPLPVFTVTEESASAETAEEPAVMDFTSFLSSQSFQEEVAEFHEETVQLEVQAETTPFEAASIPEPALEIPAPQVQEPRAQISAVGKQSESHQTEAPAMLDIFRLDTIRLEQNTVVETVETVVAMETAEPDAVASASAPFSFQLDDVSTPETAPQKNFSIQLETAELADAQAVPAPDEDDSQLEAEPVEQAIPANPSSQSDRGSRASNALNEEKDASVVVHRIKTLREEVAQEFSSLLAQFRQESATLTQQLVSKARAEAAKEFEEQVDELTGRVAERSQQLMAETVGQAQDSAAKSAEANWTKLQEEATAMVSQLNDLRSEIVKQMPALAAQILKECQSQLKREVSEEVSRTVSAVSMPAPSLAPSEAQIAEWNLQARGIVSEHAQEIAGEHSERIRQTFAEELARLANEKQRAAIEQLSAHLSQQLPQIAAQFEQHCTARSRQLTASFLESCEQNASARIDEVSSRISELAQTAVSAATEQIASSSEELAEKRIAQIDSKVEESFEYGQKRISEWLEEEQRSREKDLREQVIVQIQREFEAARMGDQEHIRKHLAQAFQELSERLKVSSLR